MHAGFGLFEQSHDSGHRERNVRAQRCAIDIERAQTHLAYDEACAKVDAGLQQGFEVADAALPVERIAAPVFERRWGHEGPQAAHGEEQDRRLIDREGRARHRQGVVRVLVFSGPHDDREAAAHACPQVGQPGRFSIASSSNEPSSAS